jgi:hypothetical protein
MGLTGLSDQLRFKGAAAWVAGFLSGVLGGLVGNQGGIRSAAMLGFSVPKESFVATATAAALAVDLARTPIYVATEYTGIASIWPLVALATAGAIVGTLVGVRMLSPYCSSSSNNCSRATFHMLVLTRSFPTRALLVDGERRTTGPASSGLDWKPILSPFG